MISCSLCDKIYKNKEMFYLHLCYDCHHKTSFCLNCDTIMVKIFENNNIFKCGVCRKITPAISKELIEVTNLPDMSNILNLSAIKENNISPNKNLNNNDNTIIYNNNNSFLNSPMANKTLLYLFGNKSTFNTPSVKPLNENIINNNFNNNINEVKGNDAKVNDFPNLNNNIEDQKNKTFDLPRDNKNNLEKNDINNKLNLTDINNDLNIKNRFHLVSNNKEKTIVQNKKRLIDYFDFDLNKSKNLDNRFNKNE